MHSLPAVQSLLSFPPEAWQKSRACCAPMIFLYRRDFSRKAGPEGSIIKLKNLLTLPSSLSSRASTPVLSVNSFTFTAGSACVVVKSPWVPQLWKEGQRGGSAGRSAATLLRHETVNSKCVWRKPKWLGCVSGKGINYLLWEMWTRCLENPWWSWRGKKRASGSSMKPSLREFSYLERTMSPAVPACVVTREIEDWRHLHPGCL